jgi:hypothetical protein
MTCRLRERGEPHAKSRRSAHVLQHPAFGPAQELQCVPRAAAEIREKFELHCRTLRVGVDNSRSSAGPWRCSGHREKETSRSRACGGTCTVTNSFGMLMRLSGDAILPVVNAGPAPVLGGEGVGYSLEREAVRAAAVLHDDRRHSAVGGPLAPNVHLQLEFGVEGSAGSRNFKNLSRGGEEPVVGRRGDGLRRESSEEEEHPKLNKNPKANGPLPRGAAALAGGTPPNWRAHGVCSNRMPEPREGHEEGSRPQPQPQDGASRGSGFVLRSCVCDQGEESFKRQDEPRSCPKVVPRPRKGWAESHPPEDEHCGEPHAPDARPHGGERRRVAVEDPSQIKCIHVFREEDGQRRDEHEERKHKTPADDRPELERFARPQDADPLGPEALGHGPGLRRILHDRDLTDIRIRDPHLALLVVTQAVRHPVGLEVARPHDGLGDCLLRLVSWSSHACDLATLPFVPARLAADVFKSIPPFASDTSPSVCRASPQCAPIELPQPYPHTEASVYGSLQI